MPLDPGLEAVLRHARIIELKQFADEVAMAAKPPRVFHHKRKLGRRALLLALRAERRRNARLVELLAR